MFSSIDLECGLLVWVRPPSAIVRCGAQAAAKASSRRGQRYKYIGQERMGYGRRMGSEPHAQNSAEMANVECSEGAQGGVEDCIDMCAGVGRGRLASVATAEAISLVFHCPGNI